MTKSNPKPQEQSGNTKSAPSESTARDTTSPPNETVESAREKRKAAISIAGNQTKATDKEPKKPSFVVNEKRRDELRAMSDADLITAAGDQLRPVDKSNTDVYKATGNTKDHLNGQEIARSPIRAEVVAFLQSRTDQSAPANVICAYMALSAGQAFKGKFNFGYITTKDGESGKRGMVARKFLVMTKKGEQPAEDTAE